MSGGHCHWRNSSQIAEGPALTGVTRYRQMDLMTMALFNAKERTRDEYAALFGRASENLVLEGTHQVPDDPRSCIFEAIYKGEA